ncbi:SOS response-associated peptidase family protein [uncultured Aquitalea sp.]|uniref:SOS response-associated peptidase n=1 Tax=uncultured Aquitalea sp. TaxID=540272 RepID=UPI0025FE700B|nr:SOS response-associated peptidase family protein [uncultured Aquitalea sp.]
MCVNYVAPSRRRLLDVWDLDGDSDDWSAEIWQDYLAPIIVPGKQGRPRLLLASYGMVPQDRWPPGARASTMNARAETVDSRPSYREAWQRRRFCLVPMLGFYEPCYESGRAERWRIGRADGAPFAVAGLWREWREADGSVLASFTQLTVNADGHPLMGRMHRPGDEKRSLVMLAEEAEAQWLYCREDAEARRLLQLYPAQSMRADPAPLPARDAPVAAPEQGSLFD